MSVSPHFSVTTAGALVLGGVAAMVLATAIALSSSKRRSDAGAPAHASHAAPSSSTPARPAASIRPETALEYPVDTGE